jgi:hypothetical protein
MWHALNKRNIYKILVGKPKKITWNIKTSGRGLDSTGSGQGPVAGSGADSNELSGSTKCFEFVEGKANCISRKTQLRVRS